jgi:hypothetical protein
MPKQRRGARLVFHGAATFLAFASSVATSRPARADATTAACIDANEQTQIAERAGRLLEARELARACDVETCPPLVRKDCAQLLDGLASSIPSLAIEIGPSASTQWTDVRVSVDGVYRAEAQGGHPFELDPGLHHLRLETPNGAVLEEHEVVLRQGERGRRVSFATRTSPAAPRRESWPSVTTWILGGVAGAAGATFAFFALTGEAKESSLAGSCAPRCTAHQLAPLHAEYLAANVSLAVAVAALAGVVASVWVGRSATRPGPP